MAKRVKRKLQESRDLLKIYLDPERISETMVFKKPKDAGFEWSSETAEHILEGYRQWFNDWVKRHLELVTEKRV